MIISPVAVNCKKCTPNIKCLLLLAGAKVFFSSRKDFSLTPWCSFSDLNSWFNKLYNTDLLSSNFNFHISLLTLGILEKKSNTFSVTEKRIYNHGSKGITTKITYTWILSNDMIIGNYVVLPLNPTQTKPFPMEYNNEKWKMYKAILHLVRHKSEFYSSKEETQ